MAFICEECADKNSSGWWIPVSRGPCEYCGYTAVCADMKYRQEDPEEVSPVQARRDEIKKSLQDILKLHLTDDFLHSLVGAANFYGNLGNFKEVKKFVRELHRLADKEPPTNLKPYFD